MPREVIEEFDPLIAEFEAEKDESSGPEGELEGELAEEEDDRSEQDSESEGGGDGRRGGSRWTTGS